MSDPGGGMNVSRSRRRKRTRPAPQPQPNPDQRAPARPRRPVYHPQPQPQPRPSPDAQDVSRAARAPRPGKAPAFRMGTPTHPFGVAGTPFGVQTARVKRATRRAASRLPDHPAVPSIPVKRHYTPAEVQAIKRAYHQGARKVGGRNFVDLYRVASIGQRRNMRQIARVINAQNEASAERVARITHIPIGLDTARARSPEEVTGSLIPAGVGRFLDERTQIPGHPGASLFDIANVPVQLGRATIEHPTAVARSSLRTAVESVTGIPQGVKGVIGHVEKQGLKKGLKTSLSAIAKDYERRYGPIFNDPARFRRQVENDYGLTPFVFDAATAGVPVGRAATLLARSGPAGRAAAALAHVADRHGIARPLAAFAGTAHKAARAPRDASRLAGLKARYDLAQLQGDAREAARLQAEIRRAEANLRATGRPGLRFSGGEGGVKAQESSRNLFVGLGQRAVDRARRGAHRRQVHAAGFDLGPGGRLVARAGARQERLPALRPGAREVVPKTSGVAGRSLRELPGVRRYTGRVARDLGGQQSVTRLRLLTHRAKVVNRVDKLLGRLGPDERSAMKYMLQLGATPDEHGIAILADRLRQINEARKAAGREKVAPILATTNDEKALIERILAHPDRYLTPGARAVADKLRSIQLEEAGRDPELTHAQELIRRMTPQGAALGVTRGPDAEFFRGVLHDLEREQRNPATGEIIRPAVPGLAAHADKLAGTMPAERAAIAREMVKAARADRKAAERAHAASGTNLAVEAEKLATRGRLARGEPVAYRLAGVRGHRFDTPEQAAEYASHLPGVPRQIRPVYRADRRAVFNARQLEQARARHEHATVLHAANTKTLNRVRNFEKGLKRVEQAAKSKSTMRLEDAATFAGKVKDAAEQHGLTAPAYWWSNLVPGDMPSLAAAGKGIRAAHANKPYKGKLFDIGAEEHGTDVFSRGVERNIKRRFQQALVTRNLETHAYEWSRGHSGQGMTVPELDKMFIDRAIDPRSVELVEPRVLRRRGTEAPGVERGQTVDPQQLEHMSEEDFVTTTQQHLAEGRRTWEEVQRDDLTHMGARRYLVVPKEVGETVDGAVSKMDNKFWRGLEVVLKQKPARILLGAANIPWLSFQVASNGLLTGLGGGINPFNVYGAAKWFRGLEPGEREAVEAELGITHGHHFGMDEPHLGATNNHMINFWRAYKKSRVGRIGHRINPLNVMFRADETQNNFFRQILFYDKARKRAYRNMGASWRGIDQSTTRLMDRILARPPDGQAALIAKHGAEFEKVAKHVNDFLGDYLRFSPAERFLLQRNVMFYGYLRFSLRFAFYTMPVGHPVMSNILSNVGRLGAQEIKDLFGVPNNYNLPVNILSQAYFGDRQDAKHGRLRTVNFGRANPFLNAVTQLDGPQQAVGLVSPLYQAIADQMFHESSFTGQIWRVGGRPTPADSDRPRNYFGSMLDLLNPTAYDVPGHEGQPRNRILEADAANLFYPYRVATKTGIPGVVAPLEPNQSSDALLWRPEPMMYADPKAQAGVRKSRRQNERLGAAGRLEKALNPFSPAFTAAPAAIKREREREKAIRERDRRPPGTRKRRAHAGGARYGGGGRYGG